MTESKFNNYNDCFEHTLNLLIIEEEMGYDYLEQNDNLNQLALLLQITLDHIGYDKDNQLDKIKKKLEESFSKRFFHPQPTNTEYELKLYRANFEFLEDIPTPAQRSMGWYKFRWNRITASDLAKAVGLMGEMSRLNLLIDKASPIDDYIDRRVTRKSNGDAIIHGIKFEEVSVMIYEERNQVKVKEFGCIPHPFIPHLAASPDGIVHPDSLNKDYVGRMLEIKNPYSRPINGIPKTEYYAQVQGQLECCDLDYCDFLETQILEYTSYDEFLNDSPVNEPNSLLFRENGMEKGVIHTWFDGNNDNKAIYDYCPRTITTIEAFREWKKMCFQKYCNKPGYVSSRTNYWKLIQYNVVLIKRDPEYFAKIRPELDRFWASVEQYRIQGVDLVIQLKEQVKINERKGHFDSGDVYMDEHEHEKMELIRKNLDFLSDTSDNDNYTNNYTQNNSPVKKKKLTKTKSVLVKPKLDFLSDDSDED